jgi:hypothetical protein
MPVPAISVLEGGQLWFSLLGYPADVGLAVGLAVRRASCSAVPGIAHLRRRMLGTPRS